MIREGGRKMENNIRAILQRNLNTYIKQSRLSQKEIAEKLGVSKAAITNWLNGSNSPNMEVLANLCTILSIPMSKMLSDETIKLTEKEKKLLDNFKQLSEKGKDELIRFSEFMLGNPENLKGSTNRTFQVVKKKQKKA